MAKGKYREWLEPDNLKRLRAWARDGLIDEQIAHNIGIRPGTLYEWKNKYPEFAEALKKGKEVVDIEVENALLKRALGYAFTEITRERWYNKDRKAYEIKVTKAVTKEVSPDVTAAIFWLKNRRPDLWRDRKDLDVKAAIHNPFAGLTTEELKKLAADDG